MEITMNDWSVAKAANNQRINEGIMDARKGVANGYTLLGILGVIFAGYTIIRLFMEVC